MRLTGKFRQRAKEELLDLLASGPKKTGDLRGTRTFHGSQTLSLWQIRTLLRESGRVKEESYWYGGPYSTTFWTLKPTDEQAQ